MGKSLSQSEVRTSSRGLTQEEARRRLREYGPNAVTEKKAASNCGAARQVLGSGTVDA
ncbi:MAG: cation-transporting P-type ATPase [Candidatus Binataceae bacterium]